MELGICRCFALWGGERSDKRLRRRRAAASAPLRFTLFGFTLFSFSLSLFSNLVPTPSSKKTKSSLSVSANLIAKEDIVNLERGCVCCSLRSDLVDAFKELDRRSSSGGTKFDNVLVETTGVADPGPVVRRLFCFFRLGVGARFA